MYMKTNDLGWKENYGIQNIGTEGSQENIMVEMRPVLLIWQKYMAELQGRSNLPENLEVEPGEEVSADEKSLYTLHSVVEKATAEMKDNKVTGDDDVPGD